MRIATLIVGLLIGALLVIQSFAAGAAGELRTDNTTAVASGAGLIMAFMWLLACGLVIAFPLVSTVLFGLSALLGLFTPTGDFEDLRFHGVVALGLAVMAFFGKRGKQRDDLEKARELQRQRDRDTRMETLLRQNLHSAQGTIPSQPPRVPVGLKSFCSSCGKPNTADDRFCAGCGASLTPPPARS